MNATPTLLQRILSQRMLLCCTTGFASGMPLYVLYQLIPAWLRDQGVDLKTIGLFSLISIPYVWKFTWAPLMDKPFLSLGRRRGWGLLSQILLLLLLASLAFFDPTTHITQIAILAFLIALCSATQDIVLDAYRREILPDEELGFGNSLFVNAYRLSSLVPGSLALILADHYPWSVSHLVVSAFMLIGITTTLLMPEPDSYQRKATGFLSVVLDPIKEFVSRNGLRNTQLILLFILFYKLGDSMATALATPFYLDLGFSKTDIASIVKVASLWSSVVGGFLGGLFMIRVGINRSLWYFGFIQLLTILGFALLSYQSNLLSVTEHPTRSLSAVQEITGIDDLQKVMHQGTDVAPIYLNELTAQKLLAACPDVPTESWPADLDSVFQPKPVVRALSTSCSGLTHQIRINVASATSLTKIFSEEEYDMMQKAKEDLGRINTFEQLTPYFSAEKITTLKQQVTLTMDSKHASAAELAQIPQLSPNAFLLFLVVSAEYFGVGLGTAAFVSFIARSTHKAYTAAQFALLTSIAGVPRTFASSASGYIIEAIGYTSFFLSCTALALPGMVLLFWVAPFRSDGVTPTEANSETKTP